MPVTGQAPLKASVSVSTLVAAGMVQVTASIMMNTLPAIVEALTEIGRLDAAQAGYVVGTDLAAQLAGTIVYMSQGKRMRWSTSVSIAIVLMALGNVLSCFAPSAGALLLTRWVAGGGAGVLRSACLVLFSRARNPTRAAAFLGAGQVASMSAALATFPWATRAVGWFGPYLMLSILALLLFATAPWWPKQLTVDDRPPVSLSFGRAGIVCLVATLLYYAAQEGAWGFLAAIGTAAGEPASLVGSALAFVGIPGVMAALTASAISARVSIRSALILSGCLTLTALYCLTIRGSTWTFPLGVGLFYFAWCGTFPFLFAIAARSDRGGNTAAAFVAADGLGLALGPTICGTLVVRSGPLAVVIFAGLTILISLMLFSLSHALANRRLAAAPVGA